MRAPPALGVGCGGHQGQGVWALASIEQNMHPTDRHPAGRSLQEGNWNQGPIFHSFFLGSFSIFVATDMYSFFKDIYTHTNI